MSTKKVLIINYYWPPSGGPAVQRWLSFSNKLAGTGWEVFVLTVDKKYATYQLYDESLLHEIDHRIQVHTTKTFEPFGLYKLIFGKKSIPKPAFADETNPSLVKKAMRFIRGNLFIPDPRKGWRKYAVQKAADLIDKHGIRCVITAGPPHSTHFIGKDLKKRFGVYWVADFHDLWTDVIYYKLLYHLPVVKKRDLALEKSILETADQVLTVGEKYKEKLLQKSPLLNSDKIKVIRIGYDEQDFERTVMVRSPQTRFTIAYTGNIADYYEPDVFIRALSKTMTQFPDVPVTLLFVGFLSNGVRQQIRENGLGDVLKETGYVSHADSVQHLFQATMLLLVNPRIANEDMVIPGKIYEYLAAQKPIINITNQTAETAAIVAQCGAGRTFSRDEQSEMESYLAQQFSIWKEKKTLDITDNASLVLSYSRKKICEELAGFIHKVI